MATINDNINEPENIFFQVEADESAEPINEAAQAAAAATAETPQPETITAPSPPPQEQVKKEPQPIAQEEPAVQEEPIEETPKEKYTITPTGDTTINAKAKTPLKIGYTVEGEPGYKVMSVSYTHLTLPTTPYV